MVRVREIERQLGEVMAGFDAALVSVADAQDLLASFTAIARMGQAGQLACTKRVADTTAARTPRDRDGRRWAGRRLGVTHGQAAGLLELAEQLDHAPATKEAFQAGKLSKEQAAEIARTASQVPDAEATLLEAAGRESLGELKRRAQRVRAGAEGAEARHRRLHEKRYLRTWTDADGAGRGSWSLPPERQAELVALLAPFREQVFTDARAQQRREPAEAYDADALLALARHAATTDADADGPADVEPKDTDLEAGKVPGGPAAAPAHATGDRTDRAGPPTSSRSKGRKRKNPFTQRMKVIVRVDKTALDRGTATDGEICEVTGTGPVPVTAVRDWIADDAFVAAVLTDGTDIMRAVHLGRSPTALQQTVLDWQQHECQALGCPNRIALETDHTDDWAHTHHTTLDELDRLCTHHHWLKTHKGWRLEPGRGKRRMLPPDHAPQPSTDDAQQHPADEATHEPSSRARPDGPAQAASAHRSGEVGQPRLFGASAAWRAGRGGLTATIRVRDPQPDDEPAAAERPRRCRGTKRTPLGRAGASEVGRARVDAPATGLDVGAARPPPGEPRPGPGRSAAAGRRPTATTADRRPPRRSNTSDAPRPKCPTTSHAPQPKRPTTSDAPQPSDALSESGNDPMTPQPNWATTSRPKLSRVEGGAKSENHR